MTARGWSPASHRRPSLGVATIRVSVPGNILLLGEYAITRPGGVGIAVAVEPRVHATATATAAAAGAGTGTAGALSGVMRSEQLGAEPGSLLRAVADVCGEALGWQITVDSTGLAGERGKRGLGSSAAVAVAATALLLRVRDGAVPRVERVMELAGVAHRAWQGGTGSGYDVATSTLGGLVQIEQRPGGLPRAHRLPADPPLLVVIEGARSLDTRSSLAAFDAWRRQSPRRAAAFVRRSARLTSAFVAGGERKRRRVLGAGAAALVALGRRIDIDMEPDELSARLAPLRRAGWRAKAVGAGGELAVALSPPGVPADEVARAGAVGVQVSAEGVRWES